MSRLEQQQVAGCEPERTPPPEPAMARVQAPERVQALEQVEALERVQPSDRCRLPEPEWPTRSRRPRAARRSTSRAARGPNWPPPAPPRSDSRPGPTLPHASPQTPTIIGSADRR
jgi:hypothetical protein